MALSNLLAGLHSTPGYADGGMVEEDDKKEGPPSKADGGPADDKDKKAEPNPGGEAKKTDEGETIHGLDGDSIIDAFLEENPDLVDTPVEEWPDEALKMLQEALNESGADDPNGFIPEEDPTDKAHEDEGTIVDEPVETPVEPTTDVENPEQDFDIAELAKLVQAGDKDGAWDMLQNMFGIGPTPDDDKGATNALDRLVASDQNIKRPANNSNALAKLLGSLKF